MRARQAWLLGVVAAAVAVVAIFAGAYRGNAATKRPVGVVSGSFVGKIAGTKVLIAVVASAPKAGTASRAVRVYFCDGTRTFQWFVGESKGNAFALRAASTGAVSSSLHPSLLHCQGARELEKAVEGARYAGSTRAVRPFRRRLRQ